MLARTEVSSEELSFTKAVLKDREREIGWWGRVPTNTIVERKYVFSSFEHYLYLEMLTQ